MSKESTFMVVLGRCAVCGQVFSFNPNKVPSVRVDGKREPICRACIEMANKVRIDGGMEPFPVLEDAYEAEEILATAGSNENVYIRRLLLEEH